MGGGAYKRCNDKRKCFARNLMGKCEILRVVYSHGHACPFCKSEIDVTNGKRYPYDTTYHLTHEESRD